MEWSVNGIKLHRVQYSGDFIPYNLPELFQGSEKLEKFTGRKQTSYRTTLLKNAEAESYATLAWSR
jgi:hypothetical protein